MAEQAAPPFQNKVVVVTGASAGIGRALCLALAPQRPRLVLAARDKDRLQEVADACRGLGAETLVVPTDVSSDAACQRLVSRVVSGFGGLDVLVNNAGFTMRARLEDVSDPTLFERLMRVNYFGPVYLTYYALAELKRSRGLIVVVSSLTGLAGVPTRTGYAASKHALLGFFDSLRIELKDSGVGVTVVCPDFVASEIDRRAAGGDGQPLGDRAIPHQGIMSAEACAARTVAAMARRQRLLVLSFRGRLGRWMKLLAPSVLDWMSARAVRSETKSP
ncbi:MAG TPA: SDR family oxidoreductase [Vicinamibacteria bacterium]|nr:SDR family oxidoreductase [Vicinamibacteria bacterium]